MLGPFPLIAMNDSPTLGINCTFRLLRPWTNPPSSSSSSSSISPKLVWAIVFRPTERVVMSNSRLRPQAGCFEHSARLGLNSAFGRQRTYLGQPVHQPVRPQKPWSAVLGINLGGLEESLPVIWVVFLAKMRSEKECC